MTAPLVSKTHSYPFMGDRYRPLFPDAVRPNGVHIIGAPGVGKSRLLGRKLIFDDFIRGIPQAVFDLPGGAIDNFVDKLNRIGPTFERRWWEQYRQPLPWEWVSYIEHVLARFEERIVYVDMSGKQAVVPFPLYYRLSEGESLAEIAQRFIEVIARLDPDQFRAPVEGMSSIKKIGMNAGIILAALGLQITEAPELIFHSEWWSGRFEEALAAYPEEAPLAIAEMRRFAKNTPEYQVRRSDSFVTKIDPILKDPRLRAMFGAALPGIDWQQVVDRRQTVLFDFRHVLSTDHLRFALLWVFIYLHTFLKMRGYAGRRDPFSVVIDEFAVLLGHPPSHQAAMADDILNLLEVTGRNFGCWITLDHQNLSQIKEPAILNALMQMGTQCIGTVTNPDEAEYLARRLFRFDPQMIRKTENVWMKLDPVLTFWGATGFPGPQVIDTRTVEYSVEEQRILSSYRLHDLRRFQFLTKMPLAEGDLAGSVELLDLSRLDPGEYPDDERLTETRRRLAARSGFSKEELLAQIEQRSLRPASKKQVKAPAKPARLERLTDDPVTAITTIPSHPVPNRDDGADGESGPSAGAHARGGSGWEHKPETDYVEVGT